MLLFYIRPKDLFVRKIEVQLLALIAQDIVCGISNLYQLIVRKFFFLFLLLALHQLHDLIKEGKGGFAPGWVQIGKGFIEQQPRRRSQHGAP